MTAPLLLPSQKVHASTLANSNIANKYIVNTASNTGLLQELATHIIM